MYEQYLQHHGILGMKWGVRRYQNKDGTLTSAGKRRRHATEKQSNQDSGKSINKDDIIVKRGSVEKHVSGNKKIKLENTETYLYDPKNQHDKKVYEGAYATYLEVGKGFTKQYVHEFVATEDLVSPSEKRRVDIFVEAYKKDPAKYYTEMNTVKDVFAQNKAMGYKLSPRNEELAMYKKDFNAKTSKADLSTYGYGVMGVLGEYGSKRSMAINAYYDAVKNKGYNALVDDNNRAVYNDAVQPFIALNGRKSLKEIKTYRLNTKARDNNVEELRDYNEKKYGHRRIAL